MTDTILSLNPPRAILDGALVSLDPVARMQQAERAMLPLLPAAAESSIGRAIIENGIAVGLVPSQLLLAPHHPPDIDIVWLRFRAACARAKMRLYPEMRAYLRNRACQADAEATARENSLHRAAGMGRR